MEYDQLIIETPGFIGHQARAGLVRRAAEQGTPLPLDMLHATEKGAIPVGLAPVRFLGDGRVVRIIGIGRTGMTQLYDGAPAVIDALRGSFGEMPKARYEGGRFEARDKDYPVTYRFDAVVTRLPRPLIAACREGRLDDVVEFADRRLHDMLKRQFAWILPDHAPPRVKNLRITKSVGVVVKDRTWRTALSMTGEMRCMLVGPWQVGSLQARGYGRIRRVLSGVPVPAEGSC
jgi:hypothetical protein